MKLRLMAALLFSMHATKGEDILFLVIIYERVRVWEGERENYNLSDRPLWLNPAVHHKMNLLNTCMIYMGLSVYVQQILPRLCLSRI